MNNGLVAGFFVGFNIGSENVSANRIIKPTLEITIENGVADTTFVYKLIKKEN